jgi:hypothetical protein
MTIPRRGIKNAQPELKPEPITHPGRVAAPAPTIPYNTPPDARFAHNCRSKREPIKRTVLADSELSWSADEKKDKS